MSASMAEVVKRHVALEDTWDFVPEGKIVCNWVECGFEIDADEDHHWRDTFADHVAEQLAANGYGKLEDAWDECEAAEYEIRLNPERNAWEAVKDNPYRRRPE